MTSSRISNKDSGVSTYPGSNTLRFLSDTVDREKRFIIYLSIIQIILGATAILYAFFLRDTVNAAVAGDRQLFIRSIIAFAILVVLQIILQFIYRWLSELTRSVIENRMKNRLFSVLLSIDYSYVSSVHSGEWMNRLTSDTRVVADGMTDIIPGVTGMAVKIIGAVIAVIILEPRSAFLIIPAAIILIVTSATFRKIMKKLHKDVQEKDGSLRVFLQDILGSMLIVRSYAVENEEISEAGKKMTDHKSARMKRNRFSNISNLGFGTIMNGAYVVGLAYCGYGILTKTMSYGDLMAIMQLIAQVQSPLANITGYLPRYYAMLASAERLLEVENNHIKENKKIRSLEEVQNVYDSDFVSMGFDNVSFTYTPPVNESSGEMPLVLSDISLDIRKGEYVAFTGQSGCGKSTVLKLLMCLYEPDSGNRYLCLSGSDCMELDTTWQKLFAYVPQGNYLMSGTIRDIVSFADRNDSTNEERIQNALKIACADGFVSELESGIDTELGEKGHGLSEGQMQRLAIARAVFSERPVLMLDECTSSLDADTEKTLIDNLRSMTDRTVVIVTHRPAVLSICDKVYGFTSNGVTEIETGIS